MKQKNHRLNSVSAGTEAIMNVVLALFSLCCIIPFIFVVIISFSSEESIRTIGYSFWPMAWSTDTYAYAFEKLPQIWRSFFNSVLITGIGTVLSTLICVLYSYALYRPDFKYRNFFNFFSFFVMLFGGGLVPTYIISKQVLGLSENYAALIVPLLVSPFNIIVMRTFFKSSVPLELIEAATIDGSGEYSTLFRIVLPIAKPGIATIALLNALAYWNDWLNGLYYLTKRTDLYTIQNLLNRLISSADFLRNNQANSMIAANIQVPSVGVRMAIAVIAIIPILLIYPFFQKGFVKGIVIGGVKG